MEHSKNPRRVAAGKLNRLKRKGLSPEGRERLRQAALRHQPWRFSTGPRTVEGKAMAAANGKKRQVGFLTVRELRAELAGGVVASAAIALVLLFLTGLFKSLPEAVLAAIVIIAVKGLI